MWLDELRHYVKVLFFTFAEDMSGAIFFTFSENMSGAKDANLFARVLLCGKVFIDRLIDG